MGQIRIFHRPARVIESDDQDEQPENLRLPELEVVREGNKALWPWARRDRSGFLHTGRARVVDMWILLVDKVPRAYGLRKFVMAEAHRASQLDENDQLPYWQRQTTRRARVKALRNTQRHNDRRWRRKSNRRRRKTAKMRWRRWMRSPAGGRAIDRMLRLTFRDAFYPQLLYKQPLDVVTT